LQYLSYHVFSHHYLPLYFPFDLFINHIKLWTSFSWCTDPNHLILFLLMLKFTQLPQSVWINSCNITTPFSGNYASHLLRIHNNQLCVLFIFKFISDKGFHEPPKTACPIVLLSSSVPSFASTAANYIHVISNDICLCNTSRKMFHLQQCTTVCLN